VASVVFGVVVHLTVGSFEGAARIRSFAAIAVIALGVLTWMVFWMRKQARAIKGNLEHRVDGAIHSDHVRRAVVAVTLFAVLREGIEAALFLIAAATEESGRDVLIGGLIGLALASVAAGMVYLGGRKLPMRAFFTVTGVVLILFAAGLLARAVGYLQSTGDIGSFNLNGVFDVRSVHWLNPGESEVGKFLTAMFGWDPRPSIEKIVTYFGYLVPVTYLFLRKPREPGAAVAGTPVPAAARQPVSVS
jgi:high-affinity iron transporter